MRITDTLDNRELDRFRLQIFLYVRSVFDKFCFNVCRLLLVFDSRCYDIAFSEKHLIHMAVRVVVIHSGPQSTYGSQPSYRIPRRVPLRTPPCITNAIGFKPGTTRWIAPWLVYYDFQKMTSICFKNMDWLKACNEITVWITVIQDMQIL